MPGKQVKNWKQYHALRRRGHSKSSAARITNSKSGPPRKGVKPAIRTNKSLKPRYRKKSTVRRTSIRRRRK